MGCRASSPQPFDTRDQFYGENSFPPTRMGWWGRDFWMIQVHYLCCALYFIIISLCYIIDYHFTIMQNQWEP